MDRLNEALLAKATEAKVLRTTKLRADTMVPSNVSYPTDPGLLAKAIRRIAATGKRTGMSWASTNLMNASGSGRFQREKTHSPRGIPH